ncbi:aldo-keto reductase superfamily protein [Sugiyamaella lignohabitans]|uniref:Aldo-keto reductase superfamily protein n=1 Tax=Sugiyamaella lignohabitans TaxID=796027 RepID=A0A167DEX0_9ASCO|nr:aldo-keto reductase superfamily protein [Sugiyamaella lignohabitans]ANB12836.1 aldo-keto reductase superfamily protein [Sugiyamaella lignohabitans]
MSYGKKAWNKWVIEDEELIFSLMKQAYDAGIRTFDTADVYSNGYSEILIGKFIKKYNIPRETLVILTKCYSRAATDPSIESTELNWINRWGLSRKHILDAVAGSVERLGTYIDVYQIHRYDPETPKEEIMEALHDVVKSGQVRYIGASSMRAIEFVQLQQVAEKNNWTKFISMQNFYNLIYREEEREMIPYCKENGVGLIPWSPIARGMLARPLGVDSERANTDLRFGHLRIGQFESDKEIIGRVEELAKKRGISMAQVSIAWTLAKGTCPIVGLSKPERIQEAVEAVKIKLTDEEISYLEEAYAPHSVTY